MLDRSRLMLEQRKCILDLIDRFSGVWNGILDETGTFSGDFGQIEVALHELAHWVTLGGGFTPPAIRLSAAVGDAIAKRSPYQGNDNEARTIAVEIAVLRRLRIGFTSWHRDRLVKFAAQGLGYDISMFQHIGSPQQHAWMIKRVKMWERRPSTKRLAQKAIAILNHG